MSFVLIYNDKTMQHLKRHKNWKQFFSEHLQDLDNLNMTLVPLPTKMEPRSKQAFARLSDLKSRIAHWSEVCLPGRNLILQGSTPPALNWRSNTCSSIFPGMPPTHTCWLGRISGCLSNQFCCIATLDSTKAVHNTLVTKDCESGLTQMIVWA